MTLLLSTALLIPLTSTVPASLPSISPTTSPLRLDDVAKLIEAIGRAGDEAEREDLERLASTRTREAALGLVGLYDRMSTTYMRLEIVRVLALFDGADEAEQPALQKLMDVATTSDVRELRRSAVAGLGRSPVLGHQFLARIVDSPAEDDVRLDAMRKHVAHARDADRDWYLSLFEAEEQREKKRNKTRARLSREAPAEERTLEIHSIPELRELAFGALAAEMSVRELDGASEDDAACVRRAALTELHARDRKAAARRAEKVFGRPDEKDANRVLAAEILADVKGERVAPDFIEVGCKFATPEQLRTTLADLLADLDDDAVDRKLVKLVGKAKLKTHERVFALRAVRGAEDPDLTGKILRALEDEEPEVRIAAIETLGRRGDPQAIPALEKLTVAPGAVEARVAALEALSLLRADDPDWREELLGHARSSDDALRNAALMSLVGDPANLEPLAQALDHDRWTTRHIALEGLASIGTKEVVPILIARLDVEDGRLREELGDALFRLTGMPFRPDHRIWSAWWEREGPGFEVLDPEQLARLDAAQEARRLRMTTRVEFLGVRIVSHRVIFLIDTSGSMVEPLRTRFVDETAGEARMDVARRELNQAIEALDGATLFNVITFASGISRWLDEGVATSDQHSREDAQAWVNQLGAGGGTNLFGGLEAAFADPDVDTIFVLSDGEPSVGEVTDQHAIRTLVNRWNRHRGVIIHTMAIGTSLDALAWLAEDSGGTYVEFR